MTTNYDWADDVLYYGHFPVSEINEDNVTRWMAAENPPFNWYVDNDPLNVSDFYSGGFTFPDLTTAAQATAAVIRQANMAMIASALDASADLDTFSAACAASPWSTGGYHGIPGYIADVPLPPIIAAPGTPPSPPPAPIPVPLEDLMFIAEGPGSTADFIYYIRGMTRRGISDPSNVALFVSCGVKDMRGANLPSAYLSLFQDQPNVD